jgi:hypothetical protein
MIFTIFRGLRDLESSLGLALGIASRTGVARIHQLKQNLEAGVFPV